jgi:eukaryotic-like serine/threonine-protein kinase
VTPERWQEAKKLLAGAIERPAGQRRDYLSQACTDAELRREVESLIAAHEQGDGSFMELPAGRAGPLPGGRKLGSYTITALVGSGGMGEVYRAHDTKLKRDVAIKVLPLAFIHDSERLARFRREARLLASLNHPNIASIHGFEDSDDIHALVMELVEGPTLADRIRRGPIAIEEALPIAKQMAEALEYAHERGIVHRDLKPANIKVTADDQVKVLDFGLAKALSGDAGSADMANSPTISEMATRSGVLLGTAAYMSPEQAKGKPVDRRADIWAFGSVLYEMLTGAIAFRGESVSETLAAILKSEPDWNRLPKDTSAHIRVLLQRCLQKDPKQRLQAMGDARIALDEVLSGTAPEMATAPAASRRRRMLPWAIAGTLAVGLILVIAVWKFGAPAPRTSMHFSVVTSFAGVQAEPAISPDGRSVAFVSDRDGHYNIYVGLLSGGSLIQITHDANFKSRPAWSPDGATIAYAELNDSGLRDIWEVPALGGTPRRVILNATDPAWSPDGKSLAYVDVTDGTLWTSGIYGENGRRLTGLEMGDTGHAAEPRFSPDGRQIAYLISYDGPYSSLQVLDLQSGKIHSLASYGALTLSPAWSPDGRSIYFAASRGGTLNIWKVPAEGGEPQQITEGQGDDAQLDISPDGKQIVFSTWRESNYLARLDLLAKPGQQNWKPLGADPGRNQLAPAYSPDGKHLAYFSNLKGVEDETIWVCDADGSNAFPLVRDDRNNVFPRWTSDSQHLIYWSQGNLGNSEAIRIVPLAGGASNTVLKEKSDIFVDVAQDGRLLFRNAKGQAEVFDPRNHSSETYDTAHPSDSVEPLRWSPDGHSISYVVRARTEDDPTAGLWVEDFKDAPRHVFLGWVESYAVGPNDQIYVVEGKADLNGSIWKVRWDGQGLTHLPSTLPMSHDYFVDPSLNPQDHLAVSPDGRYLTVDHVAILTANIGMIENAR